MPTSIKLLAYATETEPAPLDTFHHEPRPKVSVLPAPESTTQSRRDRSAKLVLHGLDEADQELVVAVLNTLRAKCFNDWRIVSDGPAHLALMGSEDAAPQSGRDGDSLEPLRLLLATDPQSTSQGVLQTPLRYTEFAAALVDVDRWLAILRASSLAGEGNELSSSRAPRGAPAA